MIFVKLQSNNPMKPMSIKSSLVLVSCKSTTHYVQPSRNHLGTNLLQFDWTSSQVRHTSDGSLAILINLSACVHVIGDVFMDSCHELWFGHVLKMCLSNSHCESIFGLNMWLDKIL